MADEHSTTSFSNLVIGLSFQRLARNCSSNTFYELRPSIATLFKKLISKTQTKETISFNCKDVKILFIIRYDRDSRTYHILARECCLSIDSTK